MSLLNLLKKRREIKRNKAQSDEDLNKAEDEEKKATDNFGNFLENYTTLKSFIPEEEKDKDKQKPNENLKNINTVQEEEYLAKIQSDPYYLYEKQKLEQKKLYGDKEYKEFQINPDIKNQNTQIDLKKYMDVKYYFDYKKKQFERHKTFLENEQTLAINKAEMIRAGYNNIKNNMEKLKLNYSLMIKMKRGQDEVTDDNFMEFKDKDEEDENVSKNESEDEENSEKENNENNDNKNKEENKEENNPENAANLQEQQLEKQEQEEERKRQLIYLKTTAGCPVESSVLLDISNIEELNSQLQDSYNKKMSSQKTNKDHTQMKQYLTLENELLQVLTMDISLKMKYLKLTRVTKKIQEVVTGKEEVNQAQIAKLYEDKKRNLEENTAKRISTLDKKYREINLDIKKKMEENTAFEYKLKNLNEDVEKTKQIIDLDSQIDGGDELYAEEENKNNNKNAVANKSLEIAEVSKLKSIVKNYYEEIEYLRAELDKLRARTFPSFLQKPDSVIYPDEK